MRPILTAAQMRAAEAEAIAHGTPAEDLMERAGATLAEAAYRFSGGMPALILCGPGNNGGDGYVAARCLAERRVAVRVAALSDPRTDAAKWARSRWSGPVEPFDEDLAPAPLLIDCLFGTGLKRPLDDRLVEHWNRLAFAARARVACDLPSGIDADSGAVLGPSMMGVGLTVTFGALKPAHRLAPAMFGMGRVVLDDIGIGVAPEWHEIGPSAAPELLPLGHKFERGLVHAIAGEMPGAIALAATAAARAGAGYVRVSTSRAIAGLPAAVVQTDRANLDDPRIGCLLVGPGLGELPQLLTLALTSSAPKVIDADGLRAVGEPERLRGQDAILTPHEGEFVRLFGSLDGSKPERALAAARRSGAVVVYKGPDTVVAGPDGQVGFAPPAPAWLATAGTGDVLAGIIASLRAQGFEAFDAACLGSWLHGRAAEIAGPGMLADDLAEAIPLALALCR